MSLIEQDIETIEAVLAQPREASGFADLVSELRRRFPDLACMRCDASDVEEEPFRSFWDVDLHLVDRSGHCAALTTDPDRANALLLARRTIAS